MTEKAETGAGGEETATAYLRANGYMICERNLRYGRYEIDIVAQKWDTVHFVEVKTRRAGAMTSPEAAIDRNKCRSVRRAAAMYMAQHHLSLEPQFDMVAVEVMPDGSTELRMIENAM